MCYLTDVDRVLSTRLPEDVIRELEDASRRLGITKKQFLSEAIRLRATDTSRQRAREILARAAGSWQREEPPEDTVRKARDPFREAWRRHEDATPQP